ncbi:MAG: hypothetical protein IT342_14260 [Candidatus Melainabacteria bacterium]|nr:hypothetical protein [Candidatus Melainabacteria bacterium]
MTTTFRTPCSEHCFCASGKSDSTVEFNASLEYEAGGKKHVEDITLVVPADSHIGQIKQVMDCAVRERITPKGSHNGFLRFRLDGRSAELTTWQRLQDIWFRITWRGKPYTGSHFVPIWPTAPAR